ncbi:hypothetical protein EDD99_1858 [Streptomyces sp. 846.5]|nr:hypothetical protein [Streptomyces sp. 846.5]TDU03430.1 hypothetical protein EDD99_1858 [Streptomyces sp. 846.5]
MEIPGLGLVTVDADFGDYVSSPLPVPVFDDALCRFVVAGYDDDDAKVDFETAISPFLRTRRWNSGTAPPTPGLFERLIDYTAEEIRRLLNQTLWHVHHPAALVFAQSLWRRTHQTVSKRIHVPL